MHSAAFLSELTRAVFYSGIGQISAQENRYTPIPPRKTARVSSASNPISDLFGKWANPVISFVLSDNIYLLQKMTNNN